jgi:hypothetical protein
MTRPAFWPKIIAKPITTITLALALVSIVLTGAISQALPAIDAIQTPEIEAISIDTKPALKTTIENLNKVDPQKPTINKLKKKSKGEITTDNKDKTQSSSTLNISIKSNKSISMDNGRNKINIKVDNHGENSVSDTKLVDNKVIYQGTKVDTIVEALDGGIRQTINIKDSSAPKSYNFPMELEAGQRIIVNNDGSANVVNSKNESITMILKPWARDANNKELSTHYTVDNNILRQHITTDNMTKYPINADPTWCGNMINIGRGWSDIRYGNKTYRGLQLIPTSCGRTALAQSIGANSVNMFFGRMFVSHLADNAWEEVVRKAPNDWIWDKKYGTNKYWSLYDQFICHLYNPATINKFDYNIEAERPRVGIPWIYFYGCNPV